MDGCGREFSVVRYHRGFFGNAFQHDAVHCDAVHCDAVHCAEVDRPAFGGLDGSEALLPMVAAHG